MEIERKFLLNELLPIDYLERYHVEQAYLSITPEVRVRKRIPVENGVDCAPYRLAIKSEGTLVREEIEHDVNEEFYNKIIQFINKSPIIKDYYIYHYNGYEIEVSIVDNSFIYAEVEFDSVEQAQKFQWPWKGAIEVTDDLSYKMKNYWQRTRK